MSIRKGLQLVRHLVAGRRNANEPLVGKPVFEHSCGSRLVRVRTKDESAIKHIVVRVTDKVQSKINVRLLLCPFSGFTFDNVMPVNDFDPARPQPLIVRQVP